MSNTKTIHGPKPLWVYNAYSGFVSQKKLSLKSNEVEGGWYEEDLTFCGFDPFYVDEDKDRLVTRVEKQLEKDLKEAQKEVARLEKSLDKLDG